MEDMKDLKDQEQSDKFLYENIFLFLKIFLNIK